MQKKAIIFMGIQASGKSTFYREWLMPLGYAHISLDQLRYRRYTVLFDKMNVKGHLITMRNNF